MSPEARLRAETELAARLTQHGAKLREAGAGITAGVTDSAERKARVRSAIREYGLETVIASTKNGAKTYSDVFSLIYGEAL